MRLVRGERRAELGSEGDFREKQRLSGRGYELEDPRSGASSAVRVAQTRASRERNRETSTKWDSTHGFLGGHHAQDAATQRRNPLHRPAHKQYEIDRCLTGAVRTRGLARRTCARQMFVGGRTPDL